jgi:hypothetical protein
MLMPGSWRSLALVVFLSALGSFVLSCAKDPLQVDRNRPPQTFLVGAPLDTTVTTTVSYSYRVHLYWRGEDPDGYVVGFLWSWDDSSIGAFRFTTKTDSIFEVTVNDSSQLTGGTGINPGNAKAHSFYIRAVDNRGKADPSLTIFNKRAYTASTSPPLVTFLGGPGAIPSGDAEIDTLCDGQPFKVCWYGRDSDGIVTRYRFDVGTYNSPLSTDSCAYFNDPSHPGSVSLSSGLYTLSVSAIDNANAVGKNQIQFVVNRDPETWFLTSGDGRPLGHFIQYIKNGEKVLIPGTFAPGDTVPYRSTGWFSWDGEDVGDGPRPLDAQGRPIGPRRPDHCEAHPERNEPNGCLSGWNFVLGPGTRDGNNPYIIGFLDTLTVGPPLVRFNKNDPGPLGQFGFTSLILDSLDAGTNLIARVASRDCSNRADGTPATFVFNCNFPPKITGLNVTPIIANPKGTGDEPCRLIEWTSEDSEDGLAWFADVKLDDTLTEPTTDQAQSIIVPDRVFRALSPSDPTHTVKVRVRDRADIYSQPPNADITFSFTLPSPGP